MDMKEIIQVIRNPFKKGFDPVVEMDKWDTYAGVDAALTQQMAYGFAHQQLSQQLLASGIVLPQAIVDPSADPNKMYVVDPRQIRGAVDLSVGPQPDHASAPPGIRHHWYGSPSDFWKITPPAKASGGSNSFLRLLQQEMDAIRRDIMNPPLEAPWQTALDRFKEAVGAVGPERNLVWDERSFALNWS